jgi:hypothetical protein
MEAMEKRSQKMKWKKFGFATVAIIALICMVTLAFGKSADYLIPVTVSKADKTEIQGYIVLHAGEILRLGLGASLKKWEDPSKLLEFELMKFMEGGSEVFLSYRFKKEPLVTTNFFSPKGIHFTTSTLNPDVLPQYIHPGKIRWIKRTGRPKEIRR